MPAEQQSATLTQPEAFLFDWDGTLVDSHPVLAAAMNKTLEAFDREPWSYDQWQAWLGLSARDAFPKEFGDQWQEARKVYLGAYGELHLDRIKAISGAPELVGMLADKTFPMAVVSNKTSSYLKQEVTHFGWQENFIAVVGSGDSAHDKPAADPVYDAQRPMGLRPSRRTWFIGDNDIDVACGRAAGCTTILVGQAYPDSKPDHRVSDLAALQDLILTAL